MKRIILLALLLCNSALAQLPGKVTTSISKLDGERQVSIHPAWVRTGGLLSADLKLGGFWSDKHPDVFLLDVVSVGTSATSVEGVKLGIGGEIIELKPAENSTTRTYEAELNRVESARRFTIPLDQLEKMTSLDNVIIQVSLARTSVEGEFSKDGPTMARPAFRKALEKITGPKSTQPSRKTPPKAGKGT